MDVVDNYLKEAVEQTFQDDDFKAQVRNTLFQLPNVAIRNLFYSIADENVNVMIDYVFAPTSKEFDAFVGKHSGVPLNVLKDFYEKHCDALISGRIMMFHFITYNTIGGFGIELSNEFGENVIEPLMKLVDVNVDIGYTIEVDYSRVFDL